jgi:hypothetical protein
MTADGWPTRAGTLVTAENRPAMASRGMVVTNHPLGSAAGAEMLGGMNAIGIDGDLTGAACWRADGTPIGVSGGRARPGVRFRLEAGRR